MLNKVTLIGNLGADPEVRYMPNGNAVANITLATTMKWKDKQSGERKESTEWHRVVFFNKLAEIVGEYLKKGSRIYVEGRLQTRKWQNSDGKDQYTTEVISSEMIMLSNNQGTDANQGETKYQSQANKNKPQANQGQPPGPPNDNFDDFDDSIPF